MTHIHAGRARFPYTPASDPVIAGPLGITSCIGDTTEPVRGSLAHAPRVPTEGIMLHLEEQRSSLPASLGGKLWLFSMH